MFEKQQKSVLILSANAYGDGHKQVANAISEAVHLEIPNINPITVDIMQLIHPHTNTLSSYFYKSSVKNFPAMYGFLYRKTRLKSSFSETIGAILSFGMRSLQKIIETTQPVVIVSTYPFAASIVSKLKEHGLIDIPAITIITDYTNHSFWLYPYTDEYVVASKQIRQQLVELGVEDYKIKDTGIPIRKSFDEHQSREALSLKYGLDPQKFTLLVMGGGDGFIGKGIEDFLAMSNNMQIIIVCGRNDKLKKQLTAKFESKSDEIIVMGFCEKMQEVMAISDLMISKPGGVTVSEAMFMELPLLIYKPLPGQEEDNTQYLLDSGLAFFAKNEQDLFSQINQIIANPNELMSIKEKYKSGHSKSSTMGVIDVIKREMNRSKDMQIYSPYNCIKYS
ncbi:MAG TPA: glycosyltransferase [Rummeliibacillus sp.]|nr:glycosyltransferase [Rummeliibacillus sp.]